MSIFRASHVQGIYPDEINEAKAYRIGRAIATLLDSKIVVVGGDVRNSTQGLKTAIIDGLLASSCNVIDLGTIPARALRFARKHLAAHAGIMITGRHYPRAQNRFKIIFGDAPIPKEKLARVSAMVDTNGFLSQRGTLRHYDPLPDYKQFITSTRTELTRGPLTANFGI